MDKVLKDWQAKLLHLERALTHLYVSLGKEYKLETRYTILMQQLFQMVAEVNLRVENNRK